MPVSAEAARFAGRYDELAASDPAVSKHMIAVEGETRLWLLGDIIGLPAFVPFAPVWSIGDIVLTLGVAILCYRTIRRAPAEDAPPADTVSALPNNK